MSNVITKQELIDAATDEAADGKPCRCEAGGMNQIDPDNRHRMPLEPAVVVVGQNVVGVFVKVGIGAAAGGSAKQPAGVRPGDAVTRRVGIPLVVGVDVVEAVVGHPADGGVFQ